MINRRQFLFGLGAASAMTAIPLARGLSIRTSHRHHTLWGDGGPSVRLGHLSDFHFSPFVSLNHICDGIDLVLKEPPDIICLTGDYVDAVAPDPAGYVDLLKRLTADTPVYACLGNHDGGRWLQRRGGPATPEAVIDILTTAGVHVLRDHTERITVRGRSFDLTGVHDLWSHDIDVHRAEFRAEKHPRIVLAHNPDTKDHLHDQPWDLMLCGHTHGGQIRFPFYGGRLTAPVKDDRYLEGLLPWRDRALHISRGIGALYGLRINCPPEVSVIELS